MFGRGRHRRRRGGTRVGELAAAHFDEADEHEPLTDGPYDEADAPRDDLNRLDLGSIRLPVPEGAQLQVEVDQAGPVRAVHLLTERGQLTVTAFAAPRSETLWTEVRAEIVRQLTADGATLQERPDGPYGREVHAVTPQVNLRFVGIDGPRWMLRGVAAGPAATHDDLVEALYEVLGDTVVVRGDDPVPARSPLPLTLPEAMAEQLKKLAAAQRAQQQPQQQPQQGRASR